jgi:hypothetical protein
VIGKSLTGYIFGGKASRDWGIEINGYYRDAQSFLYSWTNPINSPVRLRNTNQDTGMHPHVNYGPTFGNGHDLHMSDNCNQNENSYNNLGNGFRCQRDQSGGAAGPQWFNTNSYNFRVQDYEVFSIKYTSPSSIMTNTEFFDLQNLVKFNRLRLCYRKSRDDEAGALWHERCNFMRSTIALFKSEHGYIFGGYNRMEWTNRNDYAHDIGNDNFLFTLINPYKTKLTFRLISGGSNAVYDHVNYGPTFGGSHDMYTREYASNSRDSSMNPSSYQANPLGIQQGKYVAGSNDNNYFIPEYEVYQVGGLFSTSLNSGTLNQLNKKLVDLLMTSSTNDFSRVEYQLLWRASETGFSNANFHQRVDGFANTLSIIKTTTGAVFGGFTSLAWNSNNAYYADTKAFLYSLVSPWNSGSLIMPVRTGAEAQYCGGDRTLCYGSGHDLVVNDASNTNTNSYANFGTSYVGPNNLNGSVGANFTIGAYNFRTVEIEVFRVIFPLLSSTEFTNLKNLIGFQSKQFESLYRGTRDGFQVRKMHGMVDGNENIVVVVKSTTGYIFGGYMSVQFRYVNGWIVDDSAFLFSLTNPTNQSVVLYQTNYNNQDVYMNYGYGPTWGSGHDLHITDNCNSNDGSRTYCGQSYQCPFGKCNEQCGVFMHGNGNQQFVVQDIEIFTVTD